MDTRFHAVYLLTSDDPTCKGMYYVGYTVDPLRRLQQHNGEKQNGAWRTSRRGQPWRLVCCVSGFSEDRAALKFEWMWQHAPKSLDIREQTKKLLEKLKYTRDVFSGKALHKQHLLAHAKGGLRYAIGILHILLRCSLFQPVMLQLNILEPALFHAEQQRLPQDLCPPLVERRPLFIIRDPITSEELKNLLSNAGSASNSQQQQKNQLVALSQQAGFGGQNIEESDISAILPTTSYFSLSQQQPSAVNTFELNTNNSFSEQITSGFKQVFLTAEEDQHQVAEEDKLAEHRLLPCSLCGLALPQYRYVRCSNLLRHCDPSVFNPATTTTTHHSNEQHNHQANITGTESTAADGASLAITPHDVLLGGASGRCPFRAHVTCAALWFYYARRHWGDNEQSSRSQSRERGAASPSVSQHNVGVDDETAESLPPPLARWELVPTNAVRCPMCGDEQLLHWSALCQEVKRTMNASKRIAEARRRKEVEEQLAAQRERLEKAGLLGTATNASRGQKKNASSTATNNTTTTTTTTSNATSRKRTVTVTDPGTMSYQSENSNSIDDGLFHRSAEEENFLNELLGISNENSLTGQQNPVAVSSPQPSGIQPQISVPSLSKRAVGGGKKRTRSPTEQEQFIPHTVPNTVTRGRGRGTSNSHLHPCNAMVLRIIEEQARQAREAWDARREGAGGGLGAQMEEEFDFEFD